MTYNVCLVDCNSIFATNISDNIINDLYKYNLLSFNIKNTNIKKLIMHYTIYELIEYILKSNSTCKHILYFNNTQLPECSMLKFYNESDVLYIIQAILQKIKKILPINVYISKYSLAYLQHLIKTKCTDGNIILNDIQSHKKDFTNFTFNKAMLFSKRNDLKWLNREYLNCLSTKLLLIK